MDHWNTFMDHPENRAGLMQFAVNMLAGQGLAGGIGGFGEAAGRSLEAQEAAQKEAAQEDIAQQKAEAGTTTARAYAQSVAKQGQEKPLDMRRINYQASLRENGLWNKWIGGMPQPGDYIYETMKHNHPEIKNWSDLRQNPKLVAEARALHRKFNYDDAMADAMGSAGGGGDHMDGQPVYQGRNRVGVWRNGQVVPDVPSSSE